MTNKKSNSVRLSRDCATAECIGKVGDKSITGLCKKCYSSLYSWGKRSQHDLLNRVQALHLYENRMNFLMTKNKLKIIRPRKTPLPLAVLPGECKRYRMRTKYKNVVDENSEIKKIIKRRV